MQGFWKEQDCYFLRVLEDVWSSRQPSTVEKYCYSLRSFFSFCLMLNNEIVLPVDTIQAAKFLTFLRDRDMSKYTIKTALVSLKWLNCFFPGHGGALDPLQDQFLSRIVDSARRNVMSVKNQKLPFSKSMIREMMILSTNPSLEELRDSLIPSLSFSLLLRNDELIHLSCKHMTLSEEGVKFLIVSSKTDVYRNGRVLHLARQEEGFSVYNLLLKYMSKGKLRMGENKFLFGEIVSSGHGTCIDGLRSVSYKKCLEIVKKKVSGLGLNPGLYATHSSRSGAATLLAQNVTSLELLVSGRWADPRSLNSYVEINESRRFEMSRHLFI